MTTDMLCKFSDNSMMVNESLGWWCQIPRFSIRGNSPEPKLNKPRSQSSPLLRSQAASPERRSPPCAPRLPLQCTSLLQAPLDAVQHSRKAYHEINGLGGKDYVDAAHFAPWPPSEPVTVLAVDAPSLSHSTHSAKRDKAAWSCLSQEGDSARPDEPMWLMPRLSRVSRPRARRARPACESLDTGTAMETGGARRDVRRLLRGLIASLPLSTASHKSIAKNHCKSNCNVAISVQALAAPSSRSVSVQAKNVPCLANEAVCSHCDMQTNNVGEPKRSRLRDGWAGGVRALRDSHVRLVRRQLRHIERLNRALDHPKH